jgi:hypothetical protein
MRMAELAMDDEIRGIGDNGPPSPIELTREALADLSRFLTNTPVIQTEDNARDAALFVERSRKTLQDLDDARKREVGPLNEQVKAINEQFKAAREPMEKVLGLLRSRLTDYAAREEARRFREAEEKRKAAELAEAEARRAEELEREAKDNATFGEIVDVAEKVVQADQAFSDFQKADRAAALAERNTPVRLSSQLGGRAISMRTKETLVLDDAAMALAVIGVTEKLRDAILSAARDYRRLNNALPDGVSAKIERAI